ncbi:Astacin-like metalloendopeptidase [Strongyloides ratti]|uniref:Metalloendopeptidase n=1 Tax=Strongyloides ratti TaxID=34506 RepID=A0A090LKJ7_STRRB|nr:Astacin-like metalloendopeptidase [Strongyloides ratti]CEF70342.1 Astacin-like metalloendopeptidase [Strongyloides ratti]
MRSFSIIFFILEIVNTFLVNNTAFFHNHDSIRQKRGILKNMRYIWSEKEIPYYVDSLLDPTLVKTALNRISKETCLIFRHKLEKNKALFIYLHNDHYETNLGRRREIPHKIYISLYLRDIGKIIRETMRALGVEYEHNRFDRIRHIIVKKKNIQPFFLKYFSQENAFFSTYYDTKYDHRSIMHFSQYEYTRTLQKVIISKDHLMQPFMGKSKYLTFNDAKILNEKYCSFPFINHLPCFYKGYQDPRIPNICKCLPYLTGNQCEIIRPNDPQCTQRMIFAEVERQKYIILRVGGKCTFYFRTKVGSRIMMNLKFLSIGNIDRGPCNEENSIEFKYKNDYSVSGFLFCPYKNEFNFTSLFHSITIVSNFPPTNAQLQVTFKKVKKPR